MNYRIFFLSLFSFLFLTFSTASAQQSPDEFVISLMQQANGIANLEERHQENALLYLVRVTFDIPRVGKFVLGRYWRKATSEQRSKFLRVFELAAVRTFSPLLKDIPLDSFKIIRIEWHNTDYLTVFVYSTIEPEKGRIIKIRWRLDREYSRDAFNVIDITAEGVSLIVTLRSEYTSYIKRNGGRNGGIDGLISILRKKLEK